MCMNVCVCVLACKFCLFSSDFWIFAALVYFLCAMLTIFIYILFVLQQLQQAVEKRNEIIARLSSNLQEALASRDEVQLEAQSLAGQIKALQIQLQQVNVAPKFSGNGVLSRSSLIIIIFLFLVFLD